MVRTPSLTGDNGRDARGRFASGNSASRGNPHAKRVNRFRSQLLQAVTDDDLRRIARMLVEKAKGGDVRAAVALFDRLFGKPHQSLEVESTGPINLFRNIDHAKM